MENIAGRKSESDCWLNNKTRLASMFGGDRLVAGSIEERLVGKLNVILKFLELDWTGNGSPGGKQQCCNWRAIQEEHSSLVNREKVSKLEIGWAKACLGSTEL